ncbi:hydrogenase maturation nickel metallochaperone HypA [Streptomyces kaniharaensis]|uniref:Hydrogenase maturation factor HypA n=1 Tax=Streptomyces kaniharaensis TaxID=212423 RepID=A0A6N7KZC4_9ACTN|nr:hydrogenase maturation nickel metallochaperone HypA [Streptomyces kaniharaensis]MQS17046.1 hydrogenase maturation nickel metallochaperone HypA [Streptomyces kaniharaensis]
MHEMSIAVAVVEQVEAAAREHGMPGVARVRLHVGELAGVVPQALDFCFELACAGTLVEGAVLEAESVAARARCRACAVEWAVGMPPDLGCPSCGGGSVELLSGRELQILDVEWAGLPDVRAGQEG